MEARSAPGGNETCHASNKKQDGNNGEKYGWIERTCTVEHGTKQLRRGDAADKAKSEA